MIERKLNSAFRLVSLWLFGDFMYAILPLIVLLVITALLQQPLDHFQNLKEWSFASIVLYGVLIRKFVRLKVQIQQIPRSFTLDTGLQIFIVLLIVTVLVLALVILAEFKVLPEDIERLLGIAQIALFGIAAVSLLMAIDEEVRGLLWAHPMKKLHLSNRVLKAALREISRAESAIEMVANALERANSKVDLSEITPNQLDRKMQSLELVITQIEESTTQLRRTLALHRTAIREHQ